MAGGHRRFIESTFTAQFCGGQSVFDPIWSFGTENMWVRDEVKVFEMQYYVELSVPHERINKTKSKTKANRRL